jgi:hypothetical protein
VKREIKSKSLNALSKARSGKEWMRCVAYINFNTCAMSLKTKSGSHHHQLKVSETAKSFDERTANASVPECLRIQLFLF